MATVPGPGSSRRFEARVGVEEDGSISPACLRLWSITAEVWQRRLKRGDGGSARGRGRPGGYLLTYTGYDGKTGAPVDRDLKDLRTCAEAWARLEGTVREE